jgi:hypothetical protein
LGLVVSVLFFAAAFPVLKLMIGDCAPGQQDGQCGLGTFLSLLGSLVLSLVVCIVATQWFFFRWQVIRESVPQIVATNSKAAPGSLPKVGWGTFTRKKRAEE